MKNLNFLKFFFGVMLLITTVVAASCVDDNDDTEAPYLKVSPTSLSFTTNGTPAEGSQATFEISTNRHWTATVDGNKPWVTLSATQGEGSATIQVSIPEGITDKASIIIEISNKVGPLLQETVTITSGDIVPGVVIYHETFGTDAPDKSPYPFVDQYTGWVKSGEGSATVEYSGSASSLRESGKLSAGYENASGGTKLFFGANANFVINKISLTNDQTNLRLTFGGSYSKNVDGVYDNVFKPEKFHFYLSADGVSWSNAIEYSTQQADEYWVFSTSDFTLKSAVSMLYIKYAADEASVFSIDDPTLSTGNGGTIIDLGNTTDPKIVSVTPSLVNFLAEGGTSELRVEVMNQGNNKLSANGLSGTLSATVNGTSVTVVATENTGTAVSQTLTISLENGNSIPVTITQSAAGTSEGNSVSMTSAEIESGKTGSVALATNSYGLQTVNTPSTWYTWNANSINFTGVKVAIAPAANGGGIQVQGNADDTSKQGRIANVTALPNIQSMVVVLRVATSSTFDPGYNVYAGTAANPSSANSKIAASSTVETVGGYRVYTQTFDFSGGNYSYFTIMNDLAGALYIDSIKITYNR